MSNTLKWPIVKLSTLAAKDKNAIVGGPFGSDLVSRDYVPEGVPVVRGGNLPKNSNFSCEDFVFVSERKADSLHLNCAKPGDIVFTQRGTLGQVGIVPKNTPYSRFLISQSQMKMTVDSSKANSLYLYYYFRLPSTVSYIENHALQSGVPHINLGILRKFDVVCPPPPIQQKIAAVLSTYDDLIENNNRRIALLEKMAEEIYREWFVRLRFPWHEKVKVVKGVPEGWEQVTLAEVARINAHSLKIENESAWIEYLDISAVSTNQMEPPIKIRIKEAPGRARRRVNHGDVIWSSVRPGNRAYCLALNPPENLIVSTGFAVISPREKVPYTYIYRVVTTDSFVEQMVSVAKGAAYPATSFDDFGKAKILLPPANLLKKFHEICEPLHLAANIYNRQCDSLKLSRDMLLPRLISGKLSVENLDIQFPPGMGESISLATATA